MGVHDFCSQTILISQNDAGELVGALLSLSPVNIGGFTIT